MLTLRQYAPREVIIHENDRGETAYIIENGKVEITKENNGTNVHILFLETGASFGEMSMVDDLPRSATVTAVTQTLVREIHRDDLYAMMRENPDDVIKLLKHIFERLREANVIIAQLTSAHPSAAPASLSASESSGPSTSTQSSPSVNSAPNVAARLGRDHFDGWAKAPSEKSAVITIEGLTPQAIAAISVNPLQFKSFPIKIGRKTEDPLVANHMEIADKAPLQISRHHVNIVRDGDKFGVVDRGSHLGALVDDIRIGGGKHDPGPVYFKNGEGVLVLGVDSSPYRYKIKVVS